MPAASQRRQDPLSSSWQLVVLPANGVIEPCLGASVPGLAAASLADAHGDGDAAEHVSPVGPLAKGDLLILSAHMSPLAEDAHLVLALAWHALKSFACRSDDNSVPDRTLSGVKGFT